MSHPATQAGWICPGCQLERHQCDAPQPAPALILPSGALLIGRGVANFAIGGEVRTVVACSCPEILEGGQHGDD